VLLAARPLVGGDVARGGQARSALALRPLPRAAWRRPRPGALRATRQGPAGAGRSARRRVSRSLLWAGNGLSPPRRPVTCLKLHALPAWARAASPPACSLNCRRGATEVTAAAARAARLDPDTGRAKTAVNAQSRRAKAARKRILGPLPRGRARSVPGQAADGGRFCGQLAARGRNSRFPVPAFTGIKII
jgi:hypothetical protein